MGCILLKRLAAIANFQRIRIIKKAWTHIRSPLFHASKKGANNATKAITNVTTASAHV